MAQDASSGQVVRDFIARLNDKDYDGALALVADDFVWENVPMKPPANLVHGGEAMIHRLSAVFTLCERVDWRIVEQAEDGELVLNERVDTHHFFPGTFPKSDRLDARVAGVWRVREGRISLWRDFTSLDEFEDQLGATIAELGALIGRNYGEQPA